MSEMLWVSSRLILYYPGRPRSPLNRSQDFRKCRNPLTC